MVRIKLTIAYDGTDYCGWQRQANKSATVQQTIEDALASLLYQPITIHGAGRTDSGVHALGQVASFECCKPFPASNLQHALNNILPSDIRIISTEEAADDFHARYCAIGKRYIYLIDCNGQANAFNCRYGWHLPGKLDIKAMQQAAALLVGKHDYYHFSARGSNAKTTVRTIKSINIYQPNIIAPVFPWQYLHDPWVIEATADGFLYKMMRIISCRLIAVGQGIISLSDIGGYLDGSFNKNIQLAPAKGLLLANVYFK